MWLRTEDTEVPYVLADDAPVTIFAAGIRNAYDLVWHSNGYLYVPTNGTAYGDTPASPPGVAPAVPGLKEIAPQMKVTTTRPITIIIARRAGLSGRIRTSRTIQVGQPGINLMRVASRKAPGQFQIAQGEKALAKFARIIRA